jgi:hypothetical protein
MISLVLLNLLRLRFVLKIYDWFVAMNCIAIFCEFIALNIKDYYTIIKFELFFEYVYLNFNVVNYPFGTGYFLSMDWWAFLPLVCGVAW